MNVQELEPLGAVVADTTLADVDVDALRALLAERGVVVLPGQDAADDAAFVAFLRRLGPLAFTAGETHVDGFDDLNVVSNVGRATPPKSQWHVDTTYVPTPPAYTALRAVTIPAGGGETLFTDQYRAAGTLPAALRSRVEGRVITHVATGVQDDSRADHPVLRPHPLTGREALYLSTPQRCSAISGMDDAEAAEVVAALLEHSTRDDNVLRHAWSPGDVVIWDNGAVLHKADHSAVSGDRVMHRGMVADYATTSSSATSPRAST